MIITKRDNSNNPSSSSSSSNNNNYNYNNNYKENNLELKHSIFRDPLGNHGDYSRGICYEGRMKYLYSNPYNSHFGSNCEQSLEPPKEMMNNRQRHKSCIKNTKGVQLLQRLEFKRQMEVDNKTIGKKFEGKKKSQIIITTQPTHSSEWKQQHQAGCMFWVHQETGAIRSTPPDDMDTLDLLSNNYNQSKVKSHNNNNNDNSNNDISNNDNFTDDYNNSNNGNHNNGNNHNNNKKHSKNTKTNNNNNNDNNDNNDEIEATGALVYDRQEYEELLKVLG